MKTPVLQCRLFFFFFISSCLLLLQIISVGRVAAQAQAQCLSHQKRLLLQLRDSLDYYSDSSNIGLWNRNPDCCVWPGVECDISGHVITLILDNEGIVVDYIHNLHTLFRLQYLETLNLAFNSFNFIPFPVQIYNLTNLTYLNLSNAGFQGQIPNGISRLTRLVTLDLSTDLFNLEIQNLNQFLENSTQLRQLYLDGVDLSSTVVDSKFLANFLNLSTLSLSHCNLSGSFPREIFLIHGLQELNLESNVDLSGDFPSFLENGSLRMISVGGTQFSGSLPPSISNLSNLFMIDLSSCNFSGSIPSTMAQLTSLTYVDFSHNKFTGSIPHFPLSKNLTRIDFSFNGLTGPLSSKHFEGFSKVVFISLGSNYLSGKIPPSLFSLPSLKRLHLSYNSFDGFVDEYVNVSTSQLKKLDLSSNRLNESSFPKYFFEFPKLNELLLSSNSISGRIQSSLFSLPSLQALDLYDNLFDGLVDEYVNASAVSQLERLDLSSNRLNKSFPKYFFEFPNLSRLLLSSNSLGEWIMFEGLQKLGLEILDLSDNGIRGEIPSWIWGVGNGTLHHLDLSCNFLDGFEKPYTLPRCLTMLDLHSNQLRGTLPNAPVPRSGFNIDPTIYLDYSNNFFNGSIPFDLESRTLVATFLSLSNNSFTGIIPESICNASYLKVLDLSNNKLSGMLPSCLFNIVGTLQVLNLGENQISGNIPNSFPRTCVLQTLDLSRNSIQGKIPKSLVKCSSLEVLNVGRNKIVDMFPCPLTKLSSLRVIVLESNGFYGDLHCVNANHMWPNLQIIDVASNNFIGELSPKLLNWKGMTIEEDHAESRFNIRLHYLRFSHYNYQVRVTLTVKGLMMELVRILTVFTSIDFSCNNFRGIIPDTIGALTSLYFLNLSHNTLTGNIPETFGNLKMIESLDLSANQLDGKIPIELATLIFLSVLNLSFNRLSGVIPTGNQLNTFGPDSYLGNQELCGFPLPKSCKSPKTSNDGRSEIEFDGGPSEIKWEYVTSAVGFAVGLGAYLWMLLHNKRCREAYQQLEEVLIRLFGPQQHGRKSPGPRRRVRRNKL